MKNRAKNSKRFFTTTMLCILTLIAVPFADVNAQVDVTVYMDSTDQTIRGFGAANIVDWYGEDLTMDDVETAYGTGEGQLGFNILRLRISPNPADWDNGNQIETAKKAHEMGAIVWAAPWNPPASMYDPNSEQRKVDPAKYDLYAAHLDSFNTYMSNNGVPMYAISVQNEPDYADDWTAWEPNEIVTFLRDHAPSIGTRVIAPESFQFRRSYSDPILNDSLANAHTDIIGGHIYGGGTARYPLAKQKGKEVWMTEYYTSSDRSANLWPDALLVGADIHEVMEAGWHAYIWWQIKRYYSPIHDGVDVVESGQDFNDYGTVGSVTKRGYVMSQFARFVRPGFQRVYVNGPFGRGFARVSVSAFKDTTTNNMVMVVVNDESSEKELNIIVEDGTPDVLSQYRTNDELNAEKLDDLEVGSSTFAITVPAKSITTYVSDYIPVSAQEETASSPDGFELKQNYPNPFNPVTNINYSVPTTSEVSLKVYDMLGREVITLVNEKVAAGEHTSSFDASNLSSGVYIYQLKSGEFIETRKMTLIK